MPFTPIKIQKEETKPYSGFEIAVGGNWMDTSNTTKETYDPNQTKIRYGEESHDRIAKEFVYEFLENEWSFLFTWLNNMLTYGYDFEGEGAEEVENYFNKIDPTARQEIARAVLWSILDGNGYIYKVLEDEKLRQLKHTVPYNFTLDWASEKDEKYYEAGEKQRYKDNGDVNHYIVASYTSDVRNRISDPALKEKKFYFRQYPRFELKDWRNDELVLVQLLPEIDGTPNGMSPVRSCLAALKALKEVNRDTAAAIKKVLISILAVLYDTSNLRSQTDKETVLKALSAKLQALNAATSGGFAIDKMHQIGYVGSLPNSAFAGNERIVDVMKTIEPIIIPVLMTFLIPLGIVLQTGANKSIIAKQESLQRPQLDALRETVKSIISTQIIPHITEKEVTIVYKPLMEQETLAALIQTGAITREYGQEFLGIIDDDEGTYVPEANLKIQGMNNMGNDTGNNDGGTKRSPERKYSP